MNNFVMVRIQARRPVYCQYLRRQTLEGWDFGCQMLSTFKAKAGRESEISIGAPLPHESPGRPGEGKGRQTFKFVRGHKNGPRKRFVFVNMSHHEQRSF